MKRSGFTEKQITFALRQAERGTPVEEITRKLGVSQATFYRWKKRDEGLGVGELRRLRQLEEENRTLKQVVADLSLDKHILQEALRGKPERLIVNGRSCAGPRAASASASDGPVACSVPHGPRFATAANGMIRRDCGCGSGRSPRRASRTGTGVSRCSCSAKDGASITSASGACIAEINEGFAGESRVDGWHANSVRSDLRSRVQMPAGRWTSSMMR